MKSKTIDAIKSNILLQSLLSNLLILFGVLLIMKPGLENEADLIMQELVTGGNALGVPSTSILFSNFFIGVVLSALYSAIPALPWYIIFQFLLCFAALNVIIFLTLRQNSSWEVRFLSLAVLIYLGIECYSLPGYIKTAAVTSIACFYLILSLSIDDIKPSVKSCASYILPALILGIISSLVSFFVFIAVFMISALLGIIFLLIKRPFDNKSGLIKALAVSAGAATVIVILAAGLYYLDRLYYFRDPALSASIAYRLGYEKCLSYGCPFFKFRKEELAAARDAVYRLGALDPALVDTNERLIYMAQACLSLEPHEVFNFFRFESDSLSRVPFTYLWGFLAYFIARYGGKKERWAVAVSSVFGILLLFTMRMFMVLGYYRMYTLELIPLIWFLMLFFKDTRYRLEEAMSGKKTLIMLAVDIVLIVYLAFYLFHDDLPLRWSDKTDYKAVLLYEDNISGDDEESSMQENTDEK